MDLSQVEDYVARFTPEEIRDGMWLVGVFEDWGSMTTEEADEWRRRIVARQQFCDLGELRSD